MRGAGDVEEEGGVAEFLGQDFIPVEGDFLGGVDGISERDFLVEHGFSGDERVGERSGGLDLFAVVTAADVVAVSLIGADEIGAGEFLDADVEAGEINGLDPIGAAAVGELGLVFGG